MFPYAGSNKTIIPQLLALIENQQFTHFVDPFTGSGNLEHRLVQSKSSLSLSMNDLNTYAVYNLRAVFQGVGSVPPLSDIKPVDGHLSKLAIGYWSSEYRSYFDGYAAYAREHKQWWLLGLLGKALLEATFRGQAWADVDAVGFKVAEYNAGKLLDQLQRIQRWVNDRLYPKVKSSKALVTVEQVDIIEASPHSANIHKGGTDTLVYIDCPWPWRTANTDAYGFYNDINRALTGEAFMLSWDGKALYCEEQLVRNFVLPHLEQGSTILLNKQSTTEPPLDMMIVRLRQLGVQNVEPDVQLPIRGRQGKTLTNDFEQIFLLRP